MTFQPPPPPPPPAGPPAGGPPPGAWGPPPGGPPSRPAFDPKSVNQLDWAIMGLGALTLIFSFFGFYTASYGGVSESASAWHFSGGSFIAWFAMVFAVLGAAVLAMMIFAPQVKLSVPWPPRLLSLGLFAVGAVLEILAIFIHPKFYDVGGFSFGHGFSFWVSLILILAGTALSLMRLQQTGGQLPGALGNIPNIGGQHSGGPAGRAPQGPPPSYSPPPSYGPPPGAPPSYGPPPGPPPSYGPPPTPPPPPHAGP